MNIGCLEDDATDAVYPSKKSQIMPAPKRASKRPQKKMDFPSKARMPKRRIDIESMLDEDAEVPPPYSEEKVVTPKKEVKGKRNKSNFTPRNDDPFQGQDFYSGRNLSQKKSKNISNVQMKKIRQNNRFDHRQYRGNTYAPQ